MNAAPDDAQVVAELADAAPTAGEIEGTAMALAVMAAALRLRLSAGSAHGNNTHH